MGRKSNAKKQKKIGQASAQLVPAFKSVIPSGILSQDGITITYDITVDDAMMVRNPAQNNIVFIEPNDEEIRQQKLMDGWKDVHNINFQPGHFYECDSTEENFIVRVQYFHDIGARVQLFEPYGGDETLNLVIDTYRKWDACSHLQSMGYYHYHDASDFETLVKSVDHIADLCMYQADGNPDWKPDCHTGPWLYERDEWLFRPFDPEAEGFTVKLTPELEEGVK